ncbi:SDR family NAD(P)-dependent oxidoreductase [Isoptericola haloaureus]|uniref:SDR family NAD(P)-dependent oxidoreductase n=1 Tax=Isoptericola haloaureus TaxID=1542902 RepID=A0ABU7ZA44_9MICO
MSIALVTGANKGLGLETTRSLLRDGHTVYLAARDVGRGTDAAHETGARFVRLDVTDDDSVRAAAEHVRAEEGRLDVLVNNAGVRGAAKLGRIDEVTGDDMLHTFDTNVFGPVRVTGAFLPLLRCSEAPVVVNVSSGMGSLAATRDPGRPESAFPLLDYNASKTALVMVTSQYAAAFPDIRFNAVDPGATPTDLTEHRGEQTVEEGAEVIVRLASIGADGPTGGFFDREGPAVW